MRGNRHTIGAPYLFLSLPEAAHNRKDAGWHRFGNMPDGMEMIGHEAIAHDAYLGAALRQV